MPVAMSDPPADPASSPQDAPVVTAIVGIIVALFQAVTQINEMTLTFVPKILAVAAALLIFLPWMINKATDFAHHMFDLIPNLVG